MKRVLLTGLVLALVSPAFAAEKRVGKIAATSPTAKNNATTTTPFSLGGNTLLSIQCDAASYVAVTTDPAYVATADDVKVAADGLFPTSTAKGVGAAYVSVLPVTGSATCRVFIRSGDEV
jgi:hypothetical protein